MSVKTQDEAEVPPAGGGISGVAIRRPIFMAMVTLGLVVMGLFSFRRLSIDQFPNVDVPIVTVQTVYPGASPEAVEREVTRRLEEAFNSVQGVDALTSVSLEGVSQVVVEFGLGRDGDAAAQDVRARIDAVRQELPQAIEAPVVQKFDPSAQPILSLALSSRGLPVAELTHLADEGIRRRLEAVPGVGQVQIAGGLEREIRVFLLPGRMQSLGVSVQEVVGALQAQNLDVPAGRLEQPGGEELVRITGRIADPAEFAALVVATRGGRPVQLGQLARVEDTTEEERSLAFVDGRRAVSLDLLKVSGANTVEVADGVERALEEIRAALPAGTELRVVRDNSEGIRHSVSEVIFELVLGAVLTVVVVMLFLNDWKATVITALALPVSVVSAFILMNLLGFTLNILSLMGLALSIGILVDDAIVVIENIVRRRQLGEPVMVAAQRGTQEIFLAVMATTFSIVAVFVPVAFMGGIVGRFFFEFGMTVAWAVLVSLFVSFTLTPMLAAHWGVEPHDPSHAGGNPLSRAIAAFNRGFDRVAGGYRHVIRWAMGHRRATLAVAAASLVGAVALFPLVGGEFIPPTDNSAFRVTFETPEGSSLAYTRQKAAAVERAVRALPGVEFTYTTIGAGVTGTVTEGSTLVDLVDPEARELSQAELIARARQAVGGVFGVRTAVLPASDLSAGEQPIQVNLRGPDVDVLQALSTRLANEMRRIPGVVDVQSSLGEPRPEVRIGVRRGVAAELGLDVAGLAATVRPLLAGETVTTWEDPGGQERDVVLQVDPAVRASPGDLGALPVSTAARSATGAAATVPLGQVATIERGTAPAQIGRRALQRVATLSAGLGGETSLSDAGAAIQARIDAMGLPAGYTATLGGESEELAETTGYVVEAVLLAVVLIFLILASQFESLGQPVAIMLSLPLSLVGVMLALLMTGDTLNMMSMIGIIMLMGLVTKNAILLVDNANERRRAGADRLAALVEAGRERLRPILMTTLAMIFGMLPIAMATGAGALRAPMARAVIGGLVTSTLLTLVVVPVAYSYLDDFTTWLRARRDRRALRLPAAPALDTRGGR